MNTGIYIGGCACVAVYVLYSIFRKRKDLALLSPALALIFQTIALLVEVVFLDSAGARIAALYLAANMAGAMCWLVFVDLYQSGDRRRLRGPSLFLLILGAGLIVGVLAMPEAFLEGTSHGADSLMPVPTPFGMTAMGVLAATLLYSLVGLENIYVSAQHGQKWMIKFVLVGAGSAMVGTLAAVTYSMFSSEPMGRDFHSMRMLALAVSSLLLLFGWTRRERSVRIKVSRQIAYRSVVLFFFSVYLIAFGLVREMKRLAGIGLEESTLLVLVFMVGMALIILLLSTSVQRKVKAFIHRHFYEDKYDYRAEWMTFTERLARAGDNDYLTSILRAYCDTFGLSGAGVFLKAEEKEDYELAAMHELPEQCPAVVDGTGALVRTLGDRQAIVDLRERDLVDPAREVFLELEACFAVPLMVQTRLEGFLVLGRPVDNKERYGDEDFDLMIAMSGQAASTITNRRLTERLALAREMEALGRISAFIAHDLKNHVYTLSLLLENATRHIGNPEFQEDMLSTLENSLSRMNMLISQLRTLPAKEVLNRAKVDLLELALEVVAQFPGDSVQAGGQAVIAEVDRDALVKVLQNITLNGLQAAGEDGRVRIVVSRNNGFGRIEIQDNGHGMSKEFIRKEIFRPLRTTKKKGLGIGLYQSKRLVDAHGGTIDVLSEPGEGSVFIVSVPLSEGGERTARGGKNPGR